MCLAQGPQRSDAGKGSNPRPFGLESSTLALSHCAPIGSLCSEKKNVLARMADRSKVNPDLVWLPKSIAPLG